MSEIDLNLLTKIRDIGKTQRKTTSLYRVTSELNTMKYRLIIKQYTFDVDIDKPYLLKSQFLKIGDIKAVNMIKDVQISRFDNKWKVLIIEKYQRSGDLTGKIVPNQKIDVEFLKALAQGVQQLHKYHVMHLNLKPENIFINKENIVKFTDVQTPYLSSLFHKDKKTRQTSIYLPPQAGQDHMVSQKWDVWSLGVIFLSLITHQFIKTQQQPLEYLNKIIDSVKDLHLKLLIKHMICKRSQRMTIQEVLDCLKQGIQYFDHKESRIKIVSIYFDLFTQAPCLEPNRKYLLHQNIHRKINNWILCITLLHLQSKKHQLLISLQNQQKSIKTSFNYLYSSMTQNIKQYFKDWQHFFNELKQTKGQDYQLDKDGLLRIKMKVKIQQRKQQMTQLIKKQVLQQKKSNNYIIEQIKSVNQQEIIQEKKQLENNLREQHLMKKVPKNEQKHELLINELNLVFDSDEQADIKSAFRSFPNQNEEIEDIKSNIEWAIKIQVYVIGIISALYEQLGNSYDDYGDLQFAKRSYKIARQGYINQSGQNCEKEMNLLINLGNIYAKLSQFQKSIKCFKKCAFIASKLKDIETEVMAYKNCGNVALHNKDTNLAQICYVKCLKVIQKMQNDPKRELPIIYTNLSNVYLMNEQYKKSNQCIQQYMRIVPKQTGLKAGVLYFNWGFGLLHLNRFIEAFSKFEIAFKQNYKDNMRARIEKIMLNTLHQKRQLIKRQQQDYIQAIVRVRKLLLSQNKRMLDSIINGNMA